MKLIIPILPGVLILLFGGCGSDDPVPKSYQIVCHCRDDGCPADRCNFYLTLAKECSGVVPFAEVLFFASTDFPDTLPQGPYLEEERLSPDKGLFTCVSVETEKTIMVTARSDDWQWDPVEVGCPPTGGISIPLEFNCTECNNDNDCLKVKPGSKCKEHHCVF